MKKGFSFLVLACHLISCKNDSPEISYIGYTKKEISIVGLDSNYNQKDTLAMITMNIPTPLDTFYKWHNTSDCTPCGWLQYRFADKDYTQFAESGFFWVEDPDSISQLTIRHKPKKWFSDERVLKSFDKKTNVFDDHGLKNLSCKEFIIMKKEFKQIGKNSFYIIQAKTSCSHLTGKSSVFMIAITNLLDRELQIIAEKSGVDTTEFYKMIHKSILSIEIKQNT